MIPNAPYLRDSYTRVVVSHRTQRDLVSLTLWSQRSAFLLNDSCSAGAG